MDWFRIGTLISFIPWIAISLTWLIVGWLMATHAFRLERRERLIVGIGLDLVPYLWFVNVLGHWLSATPTFALAGILVLITGVAFALPQFPPMDPVLGAEEECPVHICQPSD